MGDLLFTCVNLSRHAGVDPEQVLRQATSKFERRFRGMEEVASHEFSSLEKMSADQLESCWQQVKNKELSDKE